MASSDQILIQRLHALALTINQAQNDIRAASQRGDAAYASARMIDLQNLRDLFATTAQAFRDNDPTGTQLGAFDSFLLSLDQWIEASLAALPGAIAALPTAIGAGLLGGMLPWLLGGIVIVAFLKYAKGSLSVQRRIG